MRYNSDSAYAMTEEELITALCTRVFRVRTQHKCHATSFARFSLVSVYNIVKWTAFLLWLKPNMHEEE